MDQTTRKRKRDAERARGGGRPRAARRAREGQLREGARSREAALRGRPEPDEGRIRFGRRNANLFLIAAVVILAGFIALALGDITIAPILLVIGYLVLVPWAIMARPRQHAAQGRSSAPSGARSGEPSDAATEDTLGE